MFCQQSQHKRQRFRQGIRQKQIKQLFTEKRQQHRCNFEDNRKQNDGQSNNYHKQNGQIMSNTNKAATINLTGQGIEKVVQQMLLSSKNVSNKISHLFYGKHEYETDQNHNNVNIYHRVSSQKLRKVWQIVMQNEDKPCLNEKTTNIIIDIANQDISHIICKQNDKKQLSGSKQLQNIGYKEAILKREISQRMGQILWILLNQIPKKTQASIETNKKIIDLCIQILTHNQKLISKLEGQNYQKILWFDDYVVGLCVITLCNLCVNYAHVSYILSKVPLSKLVLMIDGMLDKNNSEDLSLFIGNLLHYYPQTELTPIQQQETKLSQNINQSKIFLSTRQQQLQLTLTLNYIYTKLEQNLLINIYNLTNSNKKDQSKSRKYASPCKNQNNQGGLVLTNSRKNESKINQSKTKLGEDRKKSYSKSKTKHIYTLNQQEISKVNKIKQKYNVIGDNDQISNTHASQNYINDLMRCSIAIKQSLYSICEQQSKCNQNLMTKQGLLCNGINTKMTFDLIMGENEYVIKIQELRKAIIEQMRQVANKQMHVIQLITKLLLISLQGQPNQSSDKQIKQRQFINNENSNMIVFLKNIMRCTRFVLKQQIKLKPQDREVEQISNSQTNTQPKIANTLIIQQKRQDDQLLEYMITEYGQILFKLLHAIILIVNREVDEHQQIQKFHHSSIINDDNILKKQLLKQNMLLQQLKSEIDHAVWQIYQIYIDYLHNLANMNPFSKRGIQMGNHIADYNRKMDREIQWLEMSLITNSLKNNYNQAIGDTSKSYFQRGSQSKQTRMTQSGQQKILPLLSKYYPIFITSFKLAKPSWQQSVNHSDNAQYEQHIQIDIPKSKCLIDLLYCKLQQHNGYQGIICIILRCMKQVIVRIWDVFTQSNPESNNSIKNLTHFLIDKELSIYLLDVLLPKYQFYDSQDQCKQQICQLINKILGRYQQDA